MASRNFDPDKLAVKDAAYYRTYYLIRDKEFIADVGMLKQDILQNYPSEIGFINYLPDTLLKSGVPHSEIDKMTLVADKYHVGLDFIALYLDGFYDLLNPASLHGLHADAGIEDGWIVLRMGKEVTQKQYRELWGMVEMAREQLVGTEGLKKRKRGPEDLELIYYVSRALDNGLLIREVYSLYYNNKLTGFAHHEGEKAYSLKEFESYYDKYKFYF